ncbi:glycoside hydrolase family 18 protein [Stipitochalara longipes BDJ]|nr:glycoside hydrolase family 18 protein [Stipitochalara longipes BDJ]
MYVQTFTTPDKRPLSLLPLLQHETKVTHVILAAIHLLAEPGNITLNDNPFEAPMYDTIWDEVKTLQQNGIKVMVLLGGAAAGSYAKLNGTDAEFTAYYTPLFALLRKYNFDGLDIDIEEHVPLNVPLRLLNALYRDMGPSFILTMAPLAAALSDKDGYNLSGFSYFELEKTALIPNTNTKLVSWYNAMFYGGFARSTSFYKSCVDAGWEPSRLVLGVLDCADDGQANGFVNVTTLDQTIGELRRLYEGFGGVAGWEYHDAGMTDGGREPWEWVKKIGDALFVRQ